MTAMPMTNQHSVRAFRGASVDVVDLTLAYGPIELFDIPQGPQLQRFLSEVL